MRGHFLHSLDWVASAAGTGFVAGCECGWETSMASTREAALAEADTHTLLAYPKRLDLRDRPGPLRRLLTPTS